MKPGIMVTGFPRAGTTLLYCMLRYAVRGYNFDDAEHWRPRAGYIRKSPRAVFHQMDGRRCIAVVRDPRAILTSSHPAFPGDYFVYAHSCANDSDRGLCEWWTAIQRLQPYIVRYEALTVQPDRVQEELGRTYALDYDAKFSEFRRGRFGEYWERALGGVRELTPRSVSRDHPQIRAQFAAFPELQEVCAAMDYA